MKPVQPPAWAIAFLHWFCKPELADEIEGDLREEFATHLATNGPLIAKIRFTIGVLTFLRPFAIRHKSAGNFRFFMFRNYVRIAWRDMAAHKLFTAINVIGLAFSLSVGLIMVALLSDMFRFDEFHANKDQIRRVISTVRAPGYRTDERATSPLILADRLATLSAVKSAVRINRAIFDDFIGNAGHIPIEGYFTDPGFFNMFSFPMLHGDGVKAMSQPFTLVITRSTAMKLFNSVDVAGKQVTLKSLGEFTIGAVMEDIPKQSHLQFDVLASMTTADALARNGVIKDVTTSWGYFYRTYVYYQLRDGYNDLDVQRALDATSAEVYADADQLAATFKSQALLDIVPGPNLSMQIGPKMLPWPLIVLSLLTVVIVLSACFNYTNLSIARSLRRAKEVALRKISGARRSEVIAQFLTESVLISLVALGAGIWLFTLIRPHFLANIPAMNRLTDMQLTSGLILRFGVLAVAVGIIAGILPALLISKTRILDALRQMKTIRLVGPISLRNGLVVFQLTLSLFLITGIGIIYRQYNFAVNRDLGFDKVNTLTFDLEELNRDQVNSTLKQLKDVISVSYGSVIPGTAETNVTTAVVNDGADSLQVYTMSADPQFITDFGLRIIAGSNFPDSLAGQRERFAIVNRRFLPQLKVASAADALGKVIHCDSVELEVIGVVEDFHYTHLDEPIGPFLLRHAPNAFTHVFVKLESTHIIDAKPRVEQAVTAIAHGRKVDTRFVEEEIEATYVFYVRLIRIFGYVGCLAFVIAILGLLGMTTYAAETRRKEIGIRKVMGAGDGQIILLISRSFIVLLSIAAAIALPGVFLLFDQVVLSWSAYRVTIGALEMSIGPLILLLIGVAAIASQTFRAVRANPAETLRAD